MFAKRSRPFTPGRGARRGGGSVRGSYSASSRNSEPKGLFADGVWHCECSPRLPAQHFQVKKESKNKGRWFYTCQKPDTKRCGFFLWDDEARTREESAVLNNTRTELSRPALKTPSKPPTPQSRYPESDFLRRDKRTRDEFEDDETEDEDEFGDSLDDEQLGIMKKAAETPSKVNKVHAQATPARRRRLPWVKDEETDSTSGALPTPQTERSVKQMLLATPKTRAPNVQTATTRESDSYETSHSIEPQREPTPSPNTYRPVPLDSTPTPVRFSNAENGDPYAPNLVSEVMDFFNEERVSLQPAVTSGLKQILNKHTMRTQGITKGREISRLTLKAKDAKITELQHRIAALEADFEAERAETRLREWEAKSSMEP